MLPTVASNCAAKRLSSSWVATSIRTLVLCVQICIHRVLDEGSSKVRTIPGFDGLAGPVILVPEEIALRRLREADGRPLSRLHVRRPTPEEPAFAERAVDALEKAARLHSVERHGGVPWLTPLADEQMPAAWPTSATDNGSCVRWAGPPGGTSRATQVSALSLARGRTYLKKDLRTARPSRVVAVPTGCLAYSMARIDLGVTFRLNEPAVLRTGLIARRTGLGNRPRRKLIAPPLSRR